MTFAADKKQALKKMQVSMRSHCPANNRPLLPAAVHGANARPGHRCHVSICNENVFIFFEPKADVDGANILGNRGWRTRYGEVNSGQGELHILTGVQQNCTEDHFAGIRKMIGLQKRRRVLARTLTNASSSVVILWSSLCALHRLKRRLEQLQV